MTFSLTPGLIYIVAGLFSFLLKGKINKLFVLIVPVIAFVQLLSLSSESSFTTTFLMQQLEFLRVDKFSMVFAYVFIISSFAAFLYGITFAKKMEYSSALIYIGSALSVIFAKDLITLYIFWELMAISSTMLILLNGGNKSLKASIRYIIVHIVGGLILLAGIMLHIHQTGSTEFIQFKIQNLSTWLMLVGILVNAAAIPFSSWMPDAYPESTIMGGVILSAYTSKTAVYTLIRGFSGWEILIWLGVAMAIYGVIYGLMENNIRRVLAFSIINQIGFMVCAIGVGTPLAIAGACAHAFSHIIYKGLLWMSAGSVIKQTGKTLYTDLGGLYYKMPFTFIFGLVGALACSSFPFISGFTTKSIILKAVEYEHLFWPWLWLEIASVATFLLLGLKFIYFIFFGKNKDLQVNEAPKTMLISMGILSFICIYIGCSPINLYEILPNSKYVLEKVDSNFYQIYIAHFPYLITKFQMLFFSILAFIIFLPNLVRTNTISIDFDWFYRRLFRYVFVFIISFIDFIYQLINNVFMKLINGSSKFLNNSIPSIVYIFNVPYLRMSGVKINKQQLINDYKKIEDNRAIPFSFLGVSVFLVFIYLYYLIN